MKIMKMALALAIFFLTACASDPNLRMGNEAHKRQDWDTAFSHYATCARKGNPDCMNAVGNYLYYGNERDAAVKWWGAAAAKGSKAAARSLTHLGEPVPAPHQASSSSMDDLLAILGAVGQGMSQSARRSTHCTSMVAGDIVETSCR